MTNVEVNFLWYCLEVLNSFQGENSFYRIAKRDSKNNLVIDFLIGSKTDKIINDINLTVIENSDEQALEYDKLLQQAAYVIGTFRVRNNDDSTIIFSKLMPERIQIEKDVTCLKTGFISLNRNTELHKKIIKSLLKEAKCFYAWNLSRINRTVSQINDFESRTISTKNVEELERIKHHLENEPINYYGFTCEKSVRVLNFLEKSHKTK